MDEPNPSTCRSCRSVARMEPLSGVPYVHVGTHFVVDHAVPVERPGWFVIVLRRHAVALHELTADEWAELGALLPRLVAAVHGATNSEKEYVLQLAEAPGFQHIHWHVVGRLENDALRGTAIFELLRPTAPCTAEDLVPMCDQVRQRLADTRV